MFTLDSGLRVGILTCYDGWFPEPARALSLLGAECIVWINGRGGNVEDFIVQSTMFQSHVAMVATNQAYGGGTMIGGCRAASDPIPDKVMPAGGWSPSFYPQILERCEDGEEGYICCTYTSQG